MTLQNFYSLIKAWNFFSDFIKISDDNFYLAKAMKTFSPRIWKNFNAFSNFIVTEINSASRSGKLKIKMQQENAVCDSF